MCYKQCYKENYIVNVMLYYLRAPLKDDTSILITNSINLSSRTHVQTNLLSLVVPIIESYKYKSVHGEKYNALTVTFF